MGGCDEILEILLEESISDRGNYNSNVTEFDLFSSGAQSKRIDNSFMKDLFSSYIRSSQIDNNLKDAFEYGQHTKRFGSTSWEQDPASYGSKLRGKEMVSLGKRIQKKDGGVRLLCNRKEPPEPAINDEPKKKQKGRGDGGGDIEKQQQQQQQRHQLQEKKPTILAANNGTLSKVIDVAMQRMRQMKQLPKRIAWRHMFLLLALIATCTAYEDCNIRKDPGCHSYGLFEMSGVNYGDDTVIAHISESVHLVEIAFYKQQQEFSCIATSYGLDEPNCSDVINGSRSYYCDGRYRLQTMGNKLAVVIPNVTEDFFFCLYNAGPGDFHVHQGGIFINTTSPEVTCIVRGVPHASITRSAGGELVPGSSRITAGDTYTVTCDMNYHLRGDNSTVICIPDTTNPTSTEGVLTALPTCEAPRTVEESKSLMVFLHLFSTLRLVIVLIGLGFVGFKAYRYYKKKDQRQHSTRQPAVVFNGIGNGVGFIPVPNGAADGGHVPV